MKQYNYHEIWCYFLSFVDEGPETETTQPPKKKVKIVKVTKPSSKQRHYRRLVATEMSRARRNPYTFRLLKQKYIDIQKTEQNPDFDFELSCLAIIKETGILMNIFQRIVYWITDILKRRGNLNGIPTSAAILKRKKELIPEGVIHTREGAKVPMNEVCHHTAERSVMRPDIEEKMCDENSYEFLWKAGSDAQTGIGKINRYSDHDPDTSYNVGIQLLLI